MTQQPTGWLQDLVRTLSRSQDPRVEQALPHLRVALRFAGKDRRRHLLDALRWLDFAEPAPGVEAARELIMQSLDMVPLAPSWAAAEQAGAER